MEGNATAGPVNFMYFAPKNEEARNQALADAIKKAHDSAARAAKAMGKSDLEFPGVNLGEDSPDQSLNTYMQ